MPEKSEVIGSGVFDDSVIKPTDQLEKLLSSMVHKAHSKGEGAGYQDAIINS